MKKKKKKQTNKQKNKQNLIIFFLVNTFFKQIASNNWRSRKKGRTEKLVKKGKNFLLCNGRSRNCHITEK